MGIFGRSERRGGRHTALEQAREPEPQGGFETAATRLVTTLLEVGIDGRGRLHSATVVADEALSARGGDPDKAVDDVIARHLKLATGSGFLTSLGGFTTLVVALPANVAGFYLLATRMAAAVARIRGYDLAQREVRSAVLLSLVGADAQDLMAKAGMAVPGGRLAGMAADQLPGPALMVVNKAVGFRLLSQAGKGAFARFGRAVPLVGGAVGGGMDLWLMKQLADHVREEFPQAGALPSITA